MRIKQLHPNFIMPTKGTQFAGAFDIYMPQEGCIEENSTVKVGLGFAAEVPEGHVALILPRSGEGAKFGLELSNTCGVIDADYRGEWVATLRTKNGRFYAWNEGQRCLQFLIVPVADVQLELATELSETKRGTGGYGSTGKGVKDVA